MEALLLSDAIKRVYTMSELQDLINTQQVKSRLLELSDNHLDSWYYGRYYKGISLHIVKQFMEYITRYPQDRNLKLEFIDVINVLEPGSVVSIWDDRFTDFLADMYLNGDITMDWIVDLIIKDDYYDDKFFVQVMNDDNEQEVYNGLMRIVRATNSLHRFAASDSRLATPDGIVSKVGSRLILEQYIPNRGILRIARLLVPALMTSMGRFRLIFSILLENGYDCKEILISHLNNPFMDRKTRRAYGTIISALASDCGINLVELRDELPLGSIERNALEHIINVGDV